MMELMDKCQRVMAAKGIPPSEMDTMIASAAITSVRGYNRRYHHWLFKVEGNKVTGMAGAEMVEVGNGSEDGTKMHETCDSCAGQGCDDCNWHGAILRRID